eukprot:scaffold1899_cov182-Alexandrium_tamarense.AAC.33
MRMPLILQFILPLASCLIGTSRAFSPVQRQPNTAHKTCTVSASIIIDIDTPSTPATTPSAEYEDPFNLLTTLAATTLLQSDRRRDAIGKETGAQASSATNWIDEGSAFRLRGVLDGMMLWLPGQQHTNGGGVGASVVGSRERQDEAITWLRWMRSVPRPMVVDLSLEARKAANETVSDDFLKLLNLGGGTVDDTDGNATTTTTTTTTSNKAISKAKMQQIRNEFLNRIGCKLILLPSGQSLQGGLLEPAGSLVFGKLLYGGVTRYRILPSSNNNSNGSNTSSPKPPRRAGERTERKSSTKQHIPSWVQYGGTERKYDGVDMGPALILELSLMPKIQSGSDGGGGGGSSEKSMHVKGDMVLKRLAWSPHRMFCYVADGEEGARNNNNLANGNQTTTQQSGVSMTLHGKERNDAFASDFRSRVGGLGPQIDSIVRRVLDGRVIRPAEVDESGEMLSYKEAISQTKSQDGFAMDGASKQLSLAALEASELALLGLNPVKGCLLYGPPGCGKTALAREIARALKARAPKIVSAPELLDRWVGGSERLVRELFYDAEAELAACNGDATKSALHVIVIDEIDAVFRKRSSAEDSGEATRSSTVNQILAKLDGVESIPNVLLIGMTNRRELLDEALLRPGRLEVQIEIPLPDREDDSNQTRGRKRRALKRATNNIFDYLSPGKKGVFDLAADEVTGGYSGAELAGLVRCAGSIALSRARKDGAGVEALLITLDDIEQALTEVKV